MMGKCSGSPSQQGAIFFPTIFLFLEGISLFFCDPYMRKDYVECLIFV